MSRFAAAIEVGLAGARHEIRLILTSWTGAAILGIAQPAVLLVLVVGSVADPAPAEVGRGVVGVALTALWSFTVWTGAGVLQGDRQQGTLAACVIGVPDLRLVVIGRSLGVNIFAGLVVAATMTVTLALLRQPVRVGSVGLVTLGLALVLVSSMVVGTCLSCLFLLSRFGPQISAALMYPVFLLCGLLTPLTFLPAPLRWVSDGISMRWGMRLLTEAMSGRFDPVALGMLVGLTVAYAFAGAYAFARVTDLIRREGTVELV